MKFNMRRTARMTGLKLRKHAPEILIVAGIGSMVGAVVLAVKGSLDVKEVINDCKETEDDLTDMFENSDDYSEEEYKKDIRDVRLNLGRELAKRYAAPALLTIGGAVAIGSGTGIFKKRYGVLSASYGALDTAFKAYRERVADKYGEAEEKAIRYGLEEVEVEKETVNEKGKKKTEKEKQLVASNSPDSYSPYTYFFGPASREYEESDDYNKTFLIQEQKYWNTQLQIKGVIFLNDILRSLDIPITETGWHVGWVYEDDDPKGSDSYIDFGIFNMRERNAAFVNGQEPCIYLDFNCAPIDGKY